MQIEINFFLEIQNVFGHRQQIVFSEYGAIPVTERCECTGSFNMAYMA